MKDPNVTELVSELKDIVQRLNTVTTKLKQEDVRFKIKRETYNELFKLVDVHQTVRYEEDV